MSNKILVTGGSGFIGSHLVESLISKKYSVTVLAPYDIDNSIGWLKSIKFRKKIKIVHGDVCDQSLIYKLVKKNNLACFKHEGYWQCMDTMRDKKILEKLIKNKKAPWIKSV